MRLPLIALLWACGGTPEPAEAPAPEPVAAPESDKPSPEAVSEASRKANDAVQALGGTLKERLVGTMAKEGPAKALEVCNAEAQGLTEGVAKDFGVTVARSSLKLRNPKNAPPDWVEAWLKANEGKPAAEAKPSNEIVDGTLRAVRPIPVGPPCVVCHGDPATIPEDVKALLAEKYPDDQATGYAPGDLRGAFWAEVSLAEN